ncbi:MAG: RidA family protein [Bdellovibrionales bacterium]|nr:RidA family protein [Bdellovibrionales bacterium]
MKYLNGAEGAPNAIGPYSQATRVGNFVFLSGQIPLDPATGSLVPGGIEEQAERVMQNLQSVLKNAGANFQNVAKTTILLADLQHFAKVNEIYGKWMGDAKPARATFQVAALPLGSLIEIEMIAVV